jgi:hypothetical protein
VAVDVHPGVGEGSRQPSHAPWSVIHLGEDGLALDVGVAVVVENRLGRLVVRGRHDHVAAVAHAAAADRAEVDAARGQRLGQGRHGSGLVFQLDDELLGHGILRGRGGVILRAARLLVLRSEPVHKRGRDS